MTPAGSGPAGPLVLNGAASQADRAAQAPDPDRALAYGRDLPALLGFGPAYGRLIRFYDLSGEPDGDWSAFFAADPTVRLALDAGTDLASMLGDLEARLDRLRSAQGFDARLAAAREALRSIAHLLRLLGGPDGAGQGEAIEDVLEAWSGVRGHPGLAPHAQRLSRHLRSSPLEQALRRDAGALADAWFHQLAGCLEDIAGALTEALSERQAEAARQLVPSLEARGHPPQGALWDAFCVLFGHARRGINRFPRRLAAFYRDAILRQADRAAGPDGTRAADDPRQPGAGPDGPRDTGSDAAVPAVLSDSALTGLRTLQVVAGPLFLAPDGGPAGGTGAVPQRVLSGTVALQAALPALAEPIPLFGAQEAGRDGPLTTVAASLGFAIASPCLMLLGGRRTVTLQLTLGTASRSSLAPLLAAIGEAAGGTEANAVLAQVLQAGLAVSYSSAAGWSAVEGFTVAPPAAGSAAFALTIALGPDAAPFSAFAAPPPDAPPGDRPVLRAALLQAPVPVGPAGAAVLVHPYALLSLIALESLAIEVAVAGLAPAAVSTPAGAADIGQPFPVFGSPPVQGAAMLVSAPELWAKAVGTVTLAIAWSGLPVTSNGFYGYYYAYTVNADGETVPAGSLFDNARFTVALDVADPGMWTIPVPDPGAQPLYLFRTADGALPPTAAAPLAAATAWASSARAAAPPPYYQAANSALRLTLSGPDYAFGNVLYPPNVMAASLRLTAAASACAQQCAQDPPGGAATGHLAPVHAAIGSARDPELASALRDGVRASLSNLNGVAMGLLQGAIGGSGGPVEALLESLAAAVAKSAPHAIFVARPQPELHEHPSGTVTANLQAWIGSVGNSLGAAAQGALAEARKVLDAGESLAKAYFKVRNQPAAVVRPTMAAAAQAAQAKLPVPAATAAKIPPAATAAKMTPAATAGADAVQSCIQACMAGANVLGLPNPPWVPMAASIAIDYAAAAALPRDPGAGSFFHLLPFDAVAAAAWPEGGAVPLLAPIDPPAAVFATIAKPTRDLALAFRMAEPPSGWPTGTPDVSWARQGASGWEPLAPLRDTTGGLAHSGSVRLSLPQAEQAARLRIGTGSAAGTFPLLAALVPNPVAAAGAATGTATVTTAARPAAAPPMPDGAAPEPAFDAWLAERLRHKGFGIQAWDYARLVLDAFPLLWQAAVVQASDPGGAPAPGHVWVVPVPGPDAPNVSNPLQPTVDGAELKAIAAFLSGRISPFAAARLSVTNPPYLPMKVTATLVFAGTATAAAYQAQMNKELIAFLSPWPPGPAPRPGDYCTLRGVAQFIRQRPYVLGILAIELAPDPPGPATGWRYLTSAAAHCIDGKVEPRLQARV